MTDTQENTSFSGQNGTKTDLYQILQNDGRKHPSVIVVHEIWGLEENIRSIADRFASLGYNVFAPHLYTRFGPHFTAKNIQGAMGKFFSIPEKERWSPEGMQKALKDSSEEEKDIIQRVFSSRSDTTRTMIEDLKALITHIGSIPAAYPDKICATGFCLGGGLVFQLATEAPVQATSVFYGANPEPVTDISKISGEIIASYASEDPRVNAGIPAMLQEFISSGKEIEMKIYGGAQHAFFNDLRPSYNAAAAHDAWHRTTDFFSRVTGD